MRNIHDLSNVALLSDHGTPASENGTQAINNPYAYFHGLGIDLQDFTVKFLRKPNKSGSLVTEVFNICGIYFTAGGKDFDDLLQSVIRQYRKKCEYHRQCREAKRVRCTLNFMSRYPDATMLPPWLSN